MKGHMPLISQESPKPKNQKNDPLNRKKMEFSKNLKSLQFLMVQGSIHSNITFLGGKL